MAKVTSKKVKASKGVPAHTAISVGGKKVYRIWATEAETSDLYATQAVAARKASQDVQGKPPSDTSRVSEATAVQV